MLAITAPIFCPGIRSIQTAATTCVVANPQGGAPRPWEASVQVSPYSSVNTRHGNLFTVIPVASWPRLGPDMNFNLYHNSAYGESGPWNNNLGFSLGAGWSVSYSDQLSTNYYPDPTQITWITADGQQWVFTLNGSTWTPPLGIFEKIERDAQDQDTWRIRHPDQSFHEFHLDWDGYFRLQRIVDAVGNDLQLTYQWPQGLENFPARLTRVGDLYFVYDVANNKLLQVRQPRITTDPDWYYDRVWTFNYDANGRLYHVYGPTYSTGKHCSSTPETCTSNGDCPTGETCLDLGDITESCGWRFDKGGVPSVWIFWHRNGPRGLKEYAE